MHAYTLYTGFSDILVCVLRLVNGIDDNNGDGYDNCSTGDDNHIIK